MREWVITLPYGKRDQGGKLCPVPPVTLNSRMNRHAYRRIVAQIRDDAGLLARAHRLPTGLVAVEITLEWQPRTVRPRDNDNLTATLKPFVDGLVDHGLVADDDSSHVRTGTKVATKGSTRPFLRVRIAERAELFVEDFAGDGSPRSVVLP